MFGDPVVAFTNLAAATEPGGRLAMAVWQPYAEQEWMGEFRRAVGGPDVAPPPSDEPGASSLGDPDRLAAILTTAGFGEPALVGVREPMFYGPDVATAEMMVLGMVAGKLGALDDDARARAIATLRASLEAHLGPDGVTYRSAMWIVTAPR